MGSPSKWLEWQKRKFKGEDVPDFVDEEQRAATDAIEEQVHDHSDLQRPSDGDQ